MRVFALIGVLLVASVCSAQMTFEDAIRGVFTDNPELRPSSQWRFEKYEGSWALTDIDETRYELMKANPTSSTITYSIESEGEYEGPNDLDGRDPEGMYLDNSVDAALLYYLDEEFAVFADQIPEYGYEGAWKASAEALLKKSNYTSADQLLVARCLLLHVIESSSPDEMEFHQYLQREELLEDYSRGRAEYMDYLALGSSDRDVVEAEARLAARLSLEAHACMVIRFGGRDLEKPICERSWSAYGAALHKGMTIYGRKNDFLAAWASIICSKEKDATLPIYEPWLGEPQYRSYLKLQGLTFDMPEAMFDDSQPGVVAVFQASNVDGFSLQKAFEAYSSGKMMRKLENGNKLPFIPSPRVTLVRGMDTLRIDFRQRQYVPLPLMAALDLLSNSPNKNIRVAQGSPLNSLLKNELTVDGLAAQFGDKKLGKRLPFSSRKMAAGTDEYAQFFNESHIRAWQYWMMTNPKAQRKRWLKKQLRHFEKAYPHDEVYYGMQSPRFLEEINARINEKYSEQFLSAQQSAFEQYCDGVHYLYPAIRERKLEKDLRHLDYLKIKLGDEVRE